MKKLIKNTTLILYMGDITKESTDAIVNAANSSLTGGGGVDGAIHKAGGPEIMKECMSIGGCRTGQAVATTAGDLLAKKIIHTVGPIYKDGLHQESGLLASAYYESLLLASSMGLQSISFPSISTGAYRYPLKDAAGIALETVKDFLINKKHQITMVKFVLFSDKILKIYENELVNLK